MNFLMTPCLGVLAAAAALNAHGQADEPLARQTVVVTAARHAMALIDSPAAMSVVTRTQIEQRGADNVLDALRGELGVSLLARPISGRKAISLRGMDSRHTLVLVDGKRIGASDGVIGHSDFQNDWIPVEDIERIEVIRGPMSVLYGAEALGGVVNIITRPVGDRWAFSTLAEASLSDDARGGDGHRAALRAAGPLGRGFSLVATAADSQRDAVATPADARISDLEGRHKRDAALQLGWQMNAAQRLEGEHRQGDEDRSAGMRERSGARRFFNSDTHIERSHSALGWSADWGGAWAWRTQLRAYRSALDMDNARNNGVAALRPNALRDRVVEGQAALSPTTTQVLTAGFERRDETLLNAGLPGGQAQARHGALYLQDEWQLTPALALTLGLRGDRASRFGSEWSPRAYAVWRPAPRWTVKGGLGHGFKAPTLKQISPDYVEDEGPYTYHGNAALRPETNDAVELGVGWDTPDVGVQAMLFDNRVNDLIITRPTSVVAGRQHFVFDNQDRARLRGLEGAGSLRLAQAFKATLNYVFLDAKDGLGQRLDKRARHTLGAQLAYVHGPLDAGLRLEHTRGLVLASTVVGQPPQPVPSFSMLGAHLRVQLAGGLELGAGLDNIGNLRLADKSALFTHAETPRSLRVWLRGRW
ncbi:outer membrane receptor for ferrienterochelin and colicin [Burkholderiales bacterium JOSHI_001]|nr:outer membrane receptor for ferrienterochelin and colicin [Burkholderiales bacterium JOSHI_001]